MDTFSLLWCRDQNVVQECLRVFSCLCSAASASSNDAIVACIHHFYHFHVLKLLNTASNEDIKRAASECITHSFHLWLSSLHSDSIRSHTIYLDERCMTKYIHKSGLVFPNILSETKAFVTRNSDVLQSHSTSENVNSNGDNSLIDNTRTRPSLIRRYSTTTVQKSFSSNDLLKKSSEIETEESSVLHTTTEDVLCRLVHSLCDIICIAKDDDASMASQALYYITSETLYSPCGELHPHISSDADCLATESCKQVDSDTKTQLRVTITSQEITSSTPQEIANARPRIIRILLENKVLRDVIFKGLYRGLTHSSKETRCWAGLIANLSGIDQDISGSRIILEKLLSRIGFGPSSPFWLGQMSNLIHFGEEETNLYGVQIIHNILPHIKNRAVIESPDFATIVDDLFHVLELPIHDPRDLLKRYYVGKSLMEISTFIFTKKDPDFRLLIPMDVPKNRQRISALVQAISKESKSDEKTIQNIMLVISHVCSNSFIRQQILSFELNEGSNVVMHKIVDLMTSGNVSTLRLVLSSLEKLVLDEMGVRQFLDINGVYYLVQLASHLFSYYLQKMKETIGQEEKSNDSNGVVEFESQKVTDGINLENDCTLRNWHKNADNLSCYSLWKFSSIQDIDELFLSIFHSLGNITALPEGVKQVLEKGNILGLLLKLIEFYFEQEKSSFDNPAVSRSRTTHATATYAQCFANMCLAGDIILDHPQGVAIMINLLNSQDEKIGNQGLRAAFLLSSSLDCRHKFLQVLSANVDAFGWIVRCLHTSFDNLLYGRVKQEKRLEVLLCALAQILDNSLVDEWDIFVQEKEYKYESPKVLEEEDEKLQQTNDESICYKPDYATDYGFFPTQNPTNGQLYPLIQLIIGVFLSLPDGSPVIPPACIAICSILRRSFILRESTARCIVEKLCRFIDPGPLGLFSTSIRESQRICNEDIKERGCDSLENESLHGLKEKFDMYCSPNAIKSRAVHASLWSVHHICQCSSIAPDNLIHLEENPDCLPRLVADKSGLDVIISMEVTVPLSIASWIDNEAADTQDSLLALKILVSMAETDEGLDFVFGPYENNDDKKLNEVGYAHRHNLFHFTLYRMDVTEVAEMRQCAASLFAHMTRVASFHENLIEKGGLFHALNTLQYSVKQIAQNTLSDSACIIEADIVEKSSLALARLTVDEDGAKEFLMAANSLEMVLSPLTLAKQQSLNKVHDSITKAVKYCVGTLANALPILVDSFEKDIAEDLVERHQEYIVNALVHQLDRILIYSSEPYLTEEQQNICEELRQVDAETPTRLRVHSHQSSAQITSQAGRRLLSSMETRDEDLLLYCARVLLGLLNLDNGQILVLSHPTLRMTLAKPILEAVKHVQIARNEQSFQERSSVSGILYYSLLALNYLGKSERLTLLVDEYTNVVEGILFLAFLFQNNNPQEFQFDDIVNEECTEQARKTVYW